MTAAPEIVEPQAAPACRLIVDPPATGAWNMAVDEVLLEAALQGTCSVRCYQWSAATLSLGYFQPAAEAISPQWAGTPAVRRLSGGGAILHDRELTYSFALPAGHPLARNPRDLYEIVHQQVIELLAEHGVTVAPRGETKAELKAEFLCFARGDDFDLVHSGFKVLGSAQRRRQGTVLQHGSLVLHRSPRAPMFPGLCDLAQVTLNADALAMPLALRIGQLLLGPVDTGSLTAEERSRAEVLVHDRYSHLEWK